MYCMAKMGTSLFSKAEAMCRSKNAKLPVPKNLKENTDLVFELKKIGIYPDHFLGHHPIILGISDSVKGWTKGKLSTIINFLCFKGKWYDNDGNKLNFTNWSAGQPNNAKSPQDYAAIHSNAGTWGDYQDDPTKYGWKMGVAICLQELSAASGKLISRLVLMNR